MIECGVGFVVKEVLGKGLTDLDCSFQEDTRQREMTHTVNAQTGSET